MHSVSDICTQLLLHSFTIFQSVPRYSEAGEIVNGNIMNISWSADHRVIDGAMLARFSNLWQSYVENPELLVVELK